MNNILNKYIHIVPFGDVVILFNTYNESIITLPASNLKGGNIVNLDGQELQYLKENNFITKGEELFKKYMKVRQLPSETLSITISLTQGCNLCCSYCSQNNAKDKKLITTEVLNDIIKYISSRIQNYKYLSIHFFGGEPLLAKREIIYFKNNIEKIINPNNIFYSIVTNGVLLNNEFLNEFRNINVKVTLNEKTIHDKYRIFKNGNGSYDIICNNLKNVGEYFSSHERSRLSLRYNVSTIPNEFDDFVIYIRNNFPYIKYIELSPVYNFEFNAKNNYYTKTEFSKFYLSALKVLLENGYFVEFPMTITSACKAYSKDGVKIFPDGTVNLCNGCDCNFRLSNIKNLIEKETKYSLFKDIIDNQLPQKCLDCSLLFLCSGIQICKPNQCDFLIYDLDEFLKFYIQIINLNSRYKNQFYTSEFKYD